MADSLDKISAATGLSRAVMLGIWADVKANSALLESCARHEFEPEEPGRLGTKRRCSACGGVVDSQAAGWYKKGRDHG